MGEKTKKYRFLQATQPEICRVNQKDEEYAAVTFQKLTDALEFFIPGFLSYQTLSKHMDKLKLFSTILYFSLSLMKGYQTLGDEYSNLLMISFKDYTYEGKLLIGIRKFLMITLMTIPQYLLTKIISNSSSFFEKLKGSKKRSLNILGSINPSELIKRVLKVHMAIFFIQGTFLQISKRALGIKYIFSKKPQEHSINYKNVGIIILIQTFIELVEYLYKVYKESKAIENRRSSDLTNSEDESSKNQGQTKESDLDGVIGAKSKLCNLCYDERKVPAATLCGHIFCWECIVKACVIKPECPSCRAPCPPRKIIMLRNLE